MQSDSHRCLATMLGLALLLSCRLHAQKPVEKFFRDELGLSFVTIPPAESSFGVGSVVTGRGPKLDVWFFASNSLPDREQLKKDGVIKRERFRKDLGILRATDSLLRLFGLAALMGSVKYVRLALKEPEMEEVDRATAEQLYYTHLTEAARKRIREDRTLELVYRALHCKSMRFVLLDAKMAAVQLPLLAADTLFRVESDGVTGLFQDGWIAFRSLTYDLKKGTLAATRTAWPMPGELPAPLPGARQETTVVRARDKKPVIGFERVVIHPQ